MSQETAALARPGASERRRAPGSGDAAAGSCEPAREGGRRALRVQSARTCQLPSSLPGRDAKLNSSKRSSSPLTRRRPQKADVCIQTMVLEKPSPLLALLKKQPSAVNV